MNNHNKYIFMIIGIVIGALLTLALITFTKSESNDKLLKTNNTNHEQENKHTDEGSKRGNSSRS